MDVTRAQEGALKTHKEKHYAAIVEPDQVAGLMRAIYAYEGTALVSAALKLSARRCQEFCVRGARLMVSETRW
jgi:hypothetical protein